MFLKSVKINTSIFVNGSVYCRKKKDIFIFNLHIVYTHNYMNTFIKIVKSPIRKLKFIKFTIFPPKK